MLDVPIMFAQNQISAIFTHTRSVNLTLILIALASNCMAASDPFATESGLRHDAAQNTPCANIQTNQPLDLASVVNMTLCNNPQTREVWANSRAQAAQRKV